MCLCASVQQLGHERTLSCVRACMGACVCVSGLGCKRAVRTHLADKQAAGWLGNRLVFVCLSLCVCPIEQMEGKSAREQAVEVNSA